MARQSTALAMHLHDSSGPRPRATAAKSPADGLPDPLIELVQRRRFRGHGEFERLSIAYGPSAGSDKQTSISAPADFLFLTDADPHTPDDVFDRLRWGGQVVLVSRRKDVIQAAAKAFMHWRQENATASAEQHNVAWQVDHGWERRYLFNLPLLPRTPAYFMIARKVMLVPPGKSSDRFTYHVYLEKNGRGGFDVVKRIPTVERVLARLREKFPDADEETLTRRAKKFTEKIFPVFLTRETAMLQLLQRDMPKKFRHRVPHLVAAETDSMGFTRVLRMNWLRNAAPTAKGRGSHHDHKGQPLSQIEFARQAAELLAALHDNVGIMHLDLRLDNIVITENGVGFVDFGSAVRVGENINEAPLLAGLFDEMMRTSQIQRMLGRMTQRGEVTAEEIISSHQRVDKAIDFFYLAVQINSPLSNPDFAGLVDHDPTSNQALELAALTEKILRPARGATPFTSARDVLHGIEEIAARLA